MRSSRSSSEPAPALAGIQVGGITRGSFILRGALAVAAVSGAVTPFVRAAFAQSDATDSAILDFALRLEIVEAKFYDEALVKVPDMSSSLRHVIQDVRDHEHQHQETLNETILQLGISTSQPPKVEFGDAFTDQARFLAAAKGLEDTSVAAYNGATPQLFAATMTALVGTIPQVEARHAALIRDFLGEPITDNAFEKPLDESQVTDRVKPFITG